MRRLDPIAETRLLVATFSNRHEATKDTKKNLVAAGQRDCGESTPGSEPHLFVYSRTWSKFHSRRGCRLPSPRQSPRNRLPPTVPSKATSRIRLAACCLA